MKLKKTRKEVVVNNYIDTETGELLETTVDVKHQRILVNDRETFAMMFGSFTGVIDGLDKMSVRVIVWCSQNCLLNKNIISLVKPYRDSICKEFGVSSQTVKNSIVELKKKRILIPVGSASYKVHPRYFWRGDMSNRNKALKYILEIELDGCKNT